MKRAAAISLCFCAVAAGAALAQTYPPLHAVYAIIGKTLLDPPPEEKKDRVAIYINGDDSAREIYEAMPVPEEHDLCIRDDAGRVKVAGGLMCSRVIKAGKDSYSCSVAVKLDDGTTSIATTC